MGFFDDLGIGDLLSSVREMTTEISTLKDEVISSVVGPTDDLKNTVQDISSSLSGSDDTGASSSVSDDASE